MAMKATTTRTALAAAMFKSTQRFHRRFWMEAVDEDLGEPERESEADSEAAASMSSSSDDDEDEEDFRC